MKSAGIILLFLSAIFLGGCSQRATATIPSHSVPALSDSHPVETETPAEPMLVDVELVRQGEAQQIELLQKDPKYYIEGAFYFTQDEYASICALDDDALTTFYVTSTRCMAQNADRNAQIELASAFLYRECEAAIYIDTDKKTEPSYSKEVCFIMTSPAWIWKLSEYMVSDTGTLYHISPITEVIRQNFDTKVWPMSPQEAEEAVSQIALSRDERLRRLQAMRDFYRNTGTEVGCFALKTEDYEAFLSLPQQENYVFRVSQNTAQQYDNLIDYYIVTAKIFAAAGCDAEVYYGEGVENDIAYEGYVCFVTATPERMWELCTELNDGESDDFFFVEPQYESVKRRMDTLVWSSKGA